MSRSGEEEAAAEGEGEEEEEGAAGSALCWESRGVGVMLRHWKREKREKWGRGRLAA